MVAEMMDRRAVTADGITTEDGSSKSALVAALRLAPPSIRADLRDAEDDVVAGLMPDTLDVLALIAGYRLLCRVAIREQRLPAYDEFCGRLCERQRDRPFSSRLSLHHYKTVRRQVFETIRYAAERQFAIEPCDSGETDRSKRVKEYERQWSDIERRYGNVLDRPSLDACRAGPEAKGVECVETGDIFRSVKAACEWVCANTAYVKCLPGHIRTALKRGRKVARLTFRETGERAVYTNGNGLPVECPSFPTESPFPSIAAAARRIGVDAKVMTKALTGDGLIGIHRFSFFRKIVPAQSVSFAMAG